jgi:TonB-linked SusC/RagA family outer membrane protein
MEKRLTMILACLFLSLGMALAQTQVTGTVVSQEDGQPIIGASIKVQGTNLGTVTDSNGSFSITVTSSAKLVISYIGCKTAVVTAKPRMRITLQSDEHVLDELVVTGYGTAKKLGSIAGSVSTVGSEKFEGRPVANIGDALQGQVAGVQVFTSSGEPTASVSIRLRGVTSINASTTPLFILDGSEITSNTFKALNPEDIATMTVLKDASATAIYGSRAANGVIILTSKRGKFGEAPTVKVSAQYGISKSTGDHANMMNSSQWLDLQEMITPSLKNDAKFQAEKSYYNKYGISTDWSDVFFGGSAPTATINASVTGGSANTSYLLSYSHYTADGIMDDSNMRRETFRSNLETNVSTWLKIGANTNLSYTKYGTTAFGTSTNSVYNKVFAARTYLPIETYYEIKGLDTSDYANSTFEGYGKRKDYFDILNMYNPYYLSEIQPTTRNAFTADENVYVNINPIKGLNIRSALGLEFEEWRLSYKAMPVGPFEGAGSARESFERMYRWTVTNTIEYKFDFMGNHHVTALVGQESSPYKDQYIYTSTSGQTDTRLMLLSAGSKADMPSHTIAQTVRNSWFGTLSYNYADKYFVDLSIRRDGSSLFGENNRWATFGAAAVMWNVTKENFMAPTKSWLNDLNLKVSYGSTGNSGIDPYKALGLVGTGPLYNQVSGTAISNPSNPDLTWETVKTFNVALTGSVLKRINFDIEYYNKSTSNMLMEIPYSYSTGFSTGWGNVASMRNRGLDFTVGVDIIKNKDWFWNVSVNGNYNKNKITKLFQGLDYYTIGGTGLRMEVGHPYGEFFSVRWKGVDPRDGQNIWLDKNGNETKIYSEDDAVMTGKNQYAPWSGGFSTTLSWKGIQLDMQFTGMFDRYMTNNERYFSENARFASENNQSTAMLDMWQKPGDITTIPAADADVEFDTHLLENASFVRLKMIQLSYTLPKSILQPTHFINGVKVFFIGRNLLTFTGYKGYDPEVDSNITLGNYPNTRQYSFGVQLTF